MSLSAVSFGQLLRRFRDNHTGASAVEFAIVAPLFLALLFEKALFLLALLFGNRRAALLMESKGTCHERSYNDAS